MKPNSMLFHFHHSPSPSPSPSPSLAHKLKSSLCGFHASDSPTTSPCSCLKSTATQFPEFLRRCRLLLARITGRRRSYHPSLHFSYDSSSYALNFEDDSRHDDEFPFRDFTARFPPATVSASA